MTKEALIAELRTLSEQEQHEVIRALHEQDEADPEHWTEVSDEDREMIRRRVASTDADPARSISKNAYWTYCDQELT